MDDAEYALRKEIVATCLAMDRRGINQGTSGNVSARWKDGLLITPSGLAYDTMAPEDIVMLAMDGTPTGANTPSSEWRFHLDILKNRPEFNAVVHAHPLHCTAIAITRETIPAVHYMIAAAGGPTIRCADYATYGTAELSTNALAALEDRNACLLANHGLIACAPTLRRALWLACEVETLAHQYIIARQFGTPVVLEDDEIERVRKRFSGYGPRGKGVSKT
jgi:L-fuculose-phosphate aldolase